MRTNPPHTEDSFFLCRHHLADYQNYSNKRSLSFVDDVKNSAAVLMVPAAAGS